MVSYSTSRGELVTRSELSSEAIRVGRLLVELLPDPEALGLLALMLLQESRRAARTSVSGDLILLEDQNRSLWDRDQITEGKNLITKAFSSQRIGPYTLQAAIASTHADAAEVSATNWTRIVGFYDLLMRVQPSPVVELNRAVALGMRAGPAAGGGARRDGWGLALPRGDSERQPLLKLQTGASAGERRRAPGTADSVDQSGGSAARAQCAACS